MQIRKTAVEYFLNVLLLQYNTLLFHCEKMFTGLINYKLFVDFIVPLFEDKTFDQNLIILIVRSLANVVLKKVWAKMIILRHKLIKDENSTKQKESCQERVMTNLALSASDQIHKQVD